MKQVTTLFLKLAVIFIGIPVLALCIFLVPKIGNFAGELYPDIAYMKSLVFNRYVRGSDTFLLCSVSIF
ncbi:hypothetical protein J2T12_002053 [Paenibacillus anaericanus]|nr:hypothetical protein [Paenibacillus anaericanus]